MDPLTIMLGIAQVVPSIAKYFGGDNAKQKAEKAIKIVKDITGADDQEAVLDVLKQDPKLILELEAKLRELEIKKEEITVQKEHDRLLDIQNARGMNTENTKALGKRDWLLDVLALIPTLAIVAIVVVLLINGVNDEFSKNILNMLIGGILARFGDVYSFFMGTSRTEVASNNASRVNLEEAARETSKLNKL